jgi:hypothetical protein
MEDVVVGATLAVRAAGTEEVGVADTLKEIGGGDTHGKRDD